MLTYALPSPCLTIIVRGHIYSICKDSGNVGYFSCMMDELIASLFSSSLELMDEFFCTEALAWLIPRLVSVDY